MARASRETWAKRVERWKDSGLTAREFAAELGINAGALSHWKYQLGKEAKAESARAAAPARSRPRAQKKSNTRPAFVAAAVTTAHIEVRVSDVVLRLPVDTKARALLLWG